MPRDRHPKDRKTVADLFAFRLGRTDPLDQTHISYYDSNEVIPCDIVVLKDSAGQKITVT